MTRKNTTPTNLQVEQTFLRRAAETGNIETLTAMEESSAFYLSDADGKYLIHYAAAAGQQDVVTFLLKHNSFYQVDHTSDEIESPGLLAAKNGFFDIVQQILNHIPQQTANQLLKILLAHAIYENAPSILHFLLDHKYCSPNIRKYTGSENTRALHYTIGFGYTSCVAILLHFGADPNAMERDNLTAPILFAAQNNQVECLEALWQAGADLAVKNSAGHGIIYYLMIYNQLNTLQAIIKSRAIPPPVALQDLIAATADLKKQLTKETQTLQTLNDHLSISTGHKPASPTSKHVRLFKDVSCQTEQFSGGSKEAPSTDKENLITARPLGQRAFK